jgi:hypothetical protein
MIVQLPDGLALGVATMGALKVEPGRTVSAAQEAPIVLLDPRHRPPRVLGLLTAVPPELAPLAQALAAEVGQGWPEKHAAGVRALGAANARRRGGRELSQTPRAVYQRDRRRRKQQEVAANG